MVRRQFLKNFGLFIFGVFSYFLLRPLFYVTEPPKKRIFISEEEFSKLGNIYLEDEFILVKIGHETLAFSRRCPHLGCKLNFDPESGLIVCPCHQSKFTISGRFISGPAKKDLKQLTVLKTERGIQVEI